MTAYYNENDPFAAQWLRNLVAANLIAPGDVDERSIEDVNPDDLRGYTQCHFFAGIGVWSYALRLAGWPDDRSVWTGSCPCQPFSAAGKRGGVADERHLWPAWFWLIEQCRPSIVLGEQVASKDGLGWLDLVSDDLERAGYACGAVDTSSAISGAPHIRQRLRFVAERLEHAAIDGREQRRPEPGERSLGGGRGEDWLDNAERNGRREIGIGYNARNVRQQLDADGRHERLAHHHHHQGLEGRSGESERGPERPARTGSVAGGLADSDGRDSSAERKQRGGQHGQQQEDSGARGLADAEHLSIRDAGELGPPQGVGIREVSGQRAGVGVAGDYSADSQPGPTNGFWRDADWLFCRDGKWRPVEPGTFPLAHGAPARVGRLRAYGNAVDAQATKHFIQAYLETTGAP